MIKEGSKVEIIGVGKRSWFFDKRKMFIRKTGVVERIAEKLPGGLFDCNIILDKPIEPIGRELGCFAVKLKETK